MREIEIVKPIIKKIDMNKVLTVRELKKQLNKYEGNLDEPVIISDALGFEYFIENEIEPNTYINDAEYEPTGKTFKTDRTDKELEEDADDPIEDYDYEEISVLRLNVIKDPYVKD